MDPQSSPNWINPPFNFKSYRWGAAGGRSREGGRHTTVLHTKKKPPPINHLIHRSCPYRMDGPSTLAQPDQPVTQLQIVCVGSCRWSLGGGDSSIVNCPRHPYTYASLACKRSTWDSSKVSAFMRDATDSDLASTLIRDLMRLLACLPSGQYHRLESRGVGLSQCNENATILCDGSAAGSGASRARFGGCSVGWCLECVKPGDICMILGM